VPPPSLRHDAAVCITQEEHQDEHSNRFRTRASAHIRLARRPFNAHLLNVTFEAPHGGRRSALGGGESMPEAIAAARSELPVGDWTLVRWNLLYGD
jgi:hypothetical protein